MNVFEIFDVAIGIEKRLSNMYYKFSSLFRDSTEIHNFWVGIASHEKLHSETLTMCKAYLQWNHPSLKHKDKPLIHFSDVKELESLDSITKEYDSKIRKHRPSLQDALELLLNIENSELNHIYNRLVHVSGIKLSQKPESVQKTIYEHIRFIKTFMDKHYRGSLPAIRIEDFKEVKHLETPATVQPAVNLQATKTDKLTETVSGKIAEILQDMQYGFIAGEDNQRFMFLADELFIDKWEDIKVNDCVEFSVIQLPWGPRAIDIKIKK
ncbi:MAG: hypothetical protein HZA08_05380 [Nitrospirae bacterium]|nr:hypothetical protein [Nitrospirota bacterium]